MTTIKEYYAVPSIDFINRRFTELDYNSKEPNHDSEEWAVLSYVDYWLKNLNTKKGPKNKEMIDKIMDVCEKHGFIPNYEVSGPIISRVNELRVQSKGALISFKNHTKDGEAIILALSGEMRPVCAIPTSTSLTTFHSISEDGSYLSYIIPRDKVVVWDIRELRIVYEGFCSDCSNVCWKNNHTLIYSTDRNTICSVDLIDGETVDLMEFPGDKTHRISYNQTLNSILVCSVESIIYKIDEKEIIQIRHSLPYDSVIHPTSGGFNVLADGYFYTFSESLNDVRDLHTDIRSRKLESITRGHHSFSSSYLIDHTSGGIRLSNVRGELRFSGGSSMSIDHRGFKIEQLIDKYEAGVHRIEGDVRQALKEHGGLWMVPKSFAAHIYFIRFCKVVDDEIYADIHTFPVDYRISSEMMSGMFSSDTIPVPTLSKAEDTQYAFDVDLGIFTRTIDERGQLGFSGPFNVGYRGRGSQLIEDGDSQIFATNSHFGVICIDQDGNQKVLPGKILECDYIGPMSAVILTDGTSYRFLNADGSVTECHLPIGEVCGYCGKTVLMKSEDGITVHYEGEAFTIPDTNPERVGFVGEDMVVVLRYKGDRPNIFAADSEYLEYYVLNEGFKKKITEIARGDYIILNEEGSKISLLKINGSGEETFLSLSQFDMNAGTVRDWQGSDIPIKHRSDYSRETVDTIDVRMESSPRFVVFMNLDEISPVIHKYNITADGLKNSNNALHVAINKASSVETQLEGDYYLVSTTESDDDETDSTCMDERGGVGRQRPFRPEHRIMNGRTGRTISAGTDGFIRPVFQGLPEYSVANDSKAFMSNDGSRLFFQYSGEDVCAWNLKKGTRYPEKGSVKGQLIKPLDRCVVIAEPENDAGIIRYRCAVYDDDLVKIKGSSVSDLYYQQYVGTFDASGDLEYGGKQYTMSSRLLGEGGNVPMSLKNTDVLILIDTNAPCSGPVDVKAVPVRYGYFQNPIEISLPPDECEREIDIRNYVEARVTAVCSEKYVAVCIAQRDRDDLEIRSAHIMIYGPHEKMVECDDVVCGALMENDRRCPVFVSKDHFAFVRKNGRRFCLELHSDANVIKSVPLLEGLEDIVIIHADADCAVLYSMMDGCIYYSDWVGMKRIATSNSDLGLNSRCYSQTSKDLIFMNGMMRVSLNKETHEIIRHEIDESSVELNTGTIDKRYGIYVMRKFVE